MLLLTRAVVEMLTWSAVTHSDWLSAGQCQSLSLTVKVCVSQLINVIVTVSIECLGVAYYYYTLPFMYCNSINLSLLNRHSLNSDSFRLL